MNTRYKKQKGVALLFAVGLLSLLMVMGLAFVTNSVLIRKSAFNNRSRSQAKMLAQSAVSRAMLSIMMYQYSTSNPPTGLANKPWPTDFTGVFSYDKNDNKVYADQIRVSAQEARLDGTTVKRSYSVLDYPHNSLGYEGHKSPARWVFMYDGDSSVTNRRIIGRVAYQVLPPPGGGRKMINMRYALTGSRSGTVGPDSYHPFKQRWGRGVEDLNFDATSVFNYGGQKWSDVIPATGLLPAFYDELYNAFGTTFFPAARPNVDNYKAWIENWLTEGRVCAYPEVYAYMTNRNRPGVLHRFNISSQGNAKWDDRFSSSANSENRVKQIANSGKEFRTTHKREPNNNGLQFFRRIGSDADKTASGFGSLENLRKQIIANFNDYCDEDHIPTSDVDAETWNSDLLWNIPDGITDVNPQLKQEPKFTGNESTPYIYELGFGGEFTALSLSDDRKSLTIGMRLTPAVRLVNIYPELNPLFTEYTQYVGLRQVGLKVTAKKTSARIAYTYLDASSNPVNGTIDVELNTNLSTPAFSPGSSTASWEYDILPSDSSLHKKTIVGDSGSGRVSISIDKNDFAGNYVQKAASTSFTLSEKANITFADDKTLLALSDFTSHDTGSPYDQVLNALKARDGSISYSDLEITGISDVSLQEVSVTFYIYPGRLTLMGNYTQNNADGTTSAKMVGLDMMKSLHPIGIDTANTWNMTGTLTKDGGTFPKFMLGGLEGRDPRANLQWAMWNRRERFSALASGAAFDWNTVMNTGGNSESPYNSSTSRDKETATEPAWKGNDTDQHISTAFIRNAPMRSPWELGLIHRAVPWQTINLKKACSPDNPANPITLQDHDPSDLWAASGTTYAGGDGGILDQIKMTNSIFSAGKVDLNALSVSNNEPKTTNVLDAELLNALFVGVVKGQPVANTVTVSGTAYVRAFSDLYDPSATADNLVKTEKAKLLTSETALTQADITATTLRTAFLNSRSNSNSDEYISRSHFLNAHSDVWQALGNTTTDAAQEEIIGKTINLVDASRGALPEVVTVLIVAQTIRDVGGEGEKVSIVRLNDDGDAISKDCQIGIFDIKTQDGNDYSEANSDKKHLYFDEITGEVKLLATLIRDPLTGKIQLRAVEYID